MGKIYFIRGIIRAGELAEVVLKRVACRIHLLCEGGRVFFYCRPLRDLSKLKIHLKRLACPCLVSEVEDVIAILRVRYI